MRKSKAQCFPFGMTTAGTDTEGAPPEKSQRSLRMFILGQFFGRIPHIFAAPFACRLIPFDHFLPFIPWPNMENFRGSLRSPEMDNEWGVGVMRPSRNFFWIRAWSAAMQNYACKCLRLRLVIVSFIEIQFCMECYRPRLLFYNIIIISFIEFKFCMKYKPQAVN